MTRLLFAATTLCGAAIAMCIFTAPVAAQNDTSNGNSRVQRGFDLAPVTLSTKGLNKALVGEGSYIVNTSGCNDCHTNPPYADGGDPFLGQKEQINTEGYLAGGVEFGPFTSRNLTPRASNGRPAGLTLAQFTEVLRKGTDFKHRHPEISNLLQVMPWPVFGKLSDREIEAVYEYLRAIPCVGDADRCGA
jgi:hypothetical protein